MDGTRSEGRSLLSGPAAQERPACSVLLRDRHTPPAARPGAGQLLPTWDVSTSPGLASSHPNWPQPRSHWTRDKEGRDGPQQTVCRGRDQPGKKAKEQPETRDAELLAQRTWRREQQSRRGGHRRRPGAWRPCCSRNCPDFRPASTQDCPQRRVGTSSVLARRAPELLRQSDKTEAAPSFQETFSAGDSRPQGAWAGLQLTQAGRDPRRGGLQPAHLPTCPGPPGTAPRPRCTDDAP